jgi:type IV pilus assembly protein PilO
VQVKTKNLAVVALVTVLVLLGWYRLAYSSMASQVSKANDATQQAESQAKTLEASVRALTPSAKEKAAQQASQRELAGAIPPTPALSTFLRQTDAIQGASGVTFQSITPSPPAMSDGATTISVSINVQGSYAQVTDYLNRLMKLPRLVQVDNVSYTAAAVASSSSGQGTSGGGGPTGEVFAGQGAAPSLQLTLSAKVFTTQAVAAGTSAGSTTGSSPVSSPSK